MSDRRKQRIICWIGGLVLLGLQSLSWAAGLESRQDALQGLSHPSAQVRRDAVLWLGERGAMEDLGALAEALRDENSEVRLVAEGALVQLWSRPGDQQVDALFKSGVKQMSEGRMALAVDTFSKIVELKPDFAEGWNKRATVYYLLGNYEMSLKDCEEVMQRNPYHFGALSGYGLIYMRLGKLEQALEYFERALEVNPNMEGAQQSVAALRHQLGKQGKQAI
ncbi:MAG: tetratricopeptide repeat protein [Burkholderiales bacterium]